MNVVKSTSRLMTILMLSCVTLAGCSLMPRSDQTAPPSITQCPVRPALYVTRIGDGTFMVEESDMRDLLHYVVELEYSAGCR